MVLVFEGLFGEIDELLAPEELLFGKLSGWEVCLSGSLAAVVFRSVSLVVLVLFLRFFCVWAWFAAAFG